MYGPAVCTFCRVVIGRECRQFVPCVVLCGMDLDPLDDFLPLFIALFTIFVIFDDFRVSIELAVGLYSLWLGLITN